MVRKVLPVAAATVVAIASLVPSGSSAQAAIAEPAQSDEITLDKATKPGAIIEDAYVVTLAQTDPEKVAERAKELADKYKGTLEFVYRSAIPGFAIRIDSSIVKELAQQPDVTGVHEQSQMWFTGEQTDAPWHLAFIDQRSGLGDVYRYDTTGAGVHAYVVDSGIRRTHVEFEGRASGDVNFVPQGIDRWGTNDCHGHGTGMAALIGGRVHGVAKQIRLHTVRVGGCVGGPSTARFLAAMDWVAENAQHPAVVNLSLQGRPDGAVDAAVNHLLDLDITVVASAGNSDNNACNFSPTRVPRVITVGAIHALRDRLDGTAWGRCVDIFAPGDQVWSASNSSDTATGFFTGSTSAATAIVTGGVALYLERFPDAWPELVARTLKDEASKDQIGNPNGSDNLVLYLSPNGPGNDGVSGMRADVNGDGRDDIVTFVRGTPADVWVSLSTGRGFTSGTRWHSDFARGNEVPLLGDVNGDGRDDLISFTRGSSADVYVALSTGHSFGPRTLWHTWFAAGSEIPLVGDFNGDGRDDIATVTRGTTGDVYVALSTGAAFVGTGVMWSGYFGFGDNVPMTGDFNCDGRDDLVMFERRLHGRVSVAISTGSSFDVAGTWTSTIAVHHGVPLVGDFNGDGCDDVGDVMRGSHRMVRVALSAPAAAPRTGRRFLPPALWHSSFAPGETLPGAGDFTGDGCADLIYFTRGAAADVYVAPNVYCDGFAFSVEKWNDWFAYGLEIPMPASTW